MFASVLPIQVKREELLQFAQGAITGLKLNADLGRCVRNKNLIVFILPSSFGFEETTWAFMSCRC